MWHGVRVIANFRGSDYRNIIKISSPPGGSGWIIGAVFGELFNSSTAAENSYLVGTVGPSYSKGLLLLLYYIISCPLFFLNLYTFLA